jgi:adenylate cyclase
MHTIRNILTMASTTPTDPWPLPELTRARRAIVVVDVVESVRLMQEDEAGFIDRWRRFVHEVRTEVLPKHGGRMVKSLGDGMLLEFDRVPGAVATAFELQRRIHACSDKLGGDAVLALRIGANVADVTVDDVDIYGSGVNLAARLASLAGPGEMVVSTDVRDQVAEGLDGSVVDLGLCYLKHLTEPVRAFRLSPTVLRPALATADSTSLRPTILVAPFASSGAGASTGAHLGSAIADDLISALSASLHWNVISRLSSGRLHDGAMLDLNVLREATGATFVLSGWWRDAGTSIQVHAELSDLRDGLVLWADRFDTTTHAVFSTERDLTRHILEGLSQALMAKETQRLAVAAMPNITDYSLLLASMGLMHSMSARTADNAGSVLEHLVERHPRLPEPKAWLAKLHIIRVAQDWSSDPAKNAHQARDLLHRALDAMPDHAMSLTIAGLMSAFIDRQHEVAEQRYQQALRCNENEPLAWLFLSSVHAHRGDGARALACVQKARLLSPLDPMGYYFVGFHAWAALAAQDYASAVSLAEQALRENCQHLPALITLTMAQVLAGQPDQARQTAQRLLAIGSPNRSRRYFTVGGYLSGFPGGGQTEHAQRLGQALLEAGVPQ